MTGVPIYTIGYGNRSIEQFIALLKQYEIAYVVDVRSQPYSRYSPQFSKDALEQQLKLHAMRYMFMGDTLGGRPKDETCYVNGKVDYERVREKQFYQDGIARLRTAWEKQLRVVVMCSELRPQECHRGKLIGNTLFSGEPQIEVQHIDEHGNVRRQADINDEVIGGQPSLFAEYNEDPIKDKRVGSSRKKYTAQ